MKLPIHEMDIKEIDALKSRDARKADNFVQNRPLVSVCIITYNHERYIAQAIDSVLMQKTDFDFEILLGEDDSTDGTREICKNYASKYPNKIRLFLNDRKNVIYINGTPTGKWNFVNTIFNANGKYIALLEGDDYWIDSNKLQKQVEFLDRHDDYVICFYNTLIIFEDHPKKSMPAINIQKEDLSIEDFIRCAHFDQINPLVGPAHTSTAVFRNGLIKSFPKWFYRSAMGDLPLYMLIAQYGKGKYFDKIVSVYRKHQGGISISPIHMGIVSYKNRIEMYNSINEHFDFRYNNIIKPIISRFYLKQAECYALGKKEKLLLKSALASIMRDSSNLFEALKLVFPKTRWFMSTIFKSVDIIRKEGINYFFKKLILHLQDKFFKYVERKKSDS